MSKSVSPCSCAHAKPGILGERFFLRSAIAFTVFAINLRQRHRSARTLVVQAACNQVLHRLAAAAIRDMRGIDPGRRVEQHAGKVIGTAHSGRAVLQFLLVCFRVCDEPL
jgi:hypothetical protein